MNTTVRYSATIPSGINPLGRKGMISTPHYLASQAGLDALRRGGTAVDAAIAASAVLSVVYPHMCGLGGDSFWLIYDAARDELKALNASGRAAASASPEFYAARGFKAVPARGYMAACTVPGAVSGWDEAFKLSKTSMGSPLSWAELLDPARGYAEDGFPVGHSLAHWLACISSRPFWTFSARKTAVPTPWARPCASPIWPTACPVWPNTARMNSTTARLPAPLRTA